MLADAVYIYQLETGLIHKHPWMFACMFECDTEHLWTYVFALCIELFFQVFHRPLRISQHGPLRPDWTIYKVIVSQTLIPDWFPQGIQWNIYLQTWFRLPGAKPAEAAQKHRWTPRKVAPLKAQAVGDGVLAVMAANNWTVLLIHILAKRKTDRKTVFAKATFSL